ncbi:hypothetical protein D3C80_1470010 [compost metagenome]
MYFFHLCVAKRGKALAVEVGDDDRVFLAPNICFLANFACSLADAAVRGQIGAVRGIGQDMGQHVVDVAHHRLLFGLDAASPCTLMPRAVAKVW